MCGSSIITYKREVTNWAPLLVKVYMYLLTFYLLVLLFIILSKIEATQPSFLLTINKVFCIALFCYKVQYRPDAGPNAAVPHHAFSDIGPVV